MQIFYIKAEDKVETPKDKIRLKDIADILCREDKCQKQAEELVVYRFDENTHRVVINVLTLIQMIGEAFPQAEVVSLGAGDVVVERLQEKKWRFPELLKIALIALLCFFGAAFSIMAFHNDIDITRIFRELYELVTGKESNGFTVLEISYSIGLTVGILLFFNHIGKRRITKDPTPVEVQMRQYEENVITTLVETAERNGEEK